MQNLIPGMTWGRTVNKKQIDQFCERMEERQKIKQEKLLKQRMNKPDTKYTECTFKPKLISKTSRKSKSTTSNVAKSINKGNHRFLYSLFLLKVITRTTTRK